MWGEATYWDKGCPRNKQKKKISLKFSDLTDVDIGLHKLNDMKEGKNDSPAAFAKQLYEVAVESYDPQIDIGTNKIIQRNLVTIFINGLVSLEVTCKVMRSKPKTLTEATTTAMSEYQL